MFKVLKAIVDRVSLDRMINHALEVKSFKTSNHQDKFIAFLAKNATLLSSKAFSMQECIELCNRTMKFRAYDSSTNAVDNALAMQERIHRNYIQSAEKQLRRRVNVRSEVACTINATVSVNDDKMKLHKIALAKHAAKQLAKSARKLNAIYSK